MGKELIRRLVDKIQLVVFDRNPVILKTVTKEWDVIVAATLEEVAECGVVILAVPDKEIIGCMKLLNQIDRPVVVINVATNITQASLEKIAASHVRCISAKFIGHAGEMALGLDPVIIINDNPPELATIAKQIFLFVGQIVVGTADLVCLVNTVAAEKAIKAAVDIEAILLKQGIIEDEIIRGAIRQVAAGVIKAYADQELGPFAREIVRRVCSSVKTVNEEKEEKT
ncbi:MAG: hypothetical protein H6Q74_1311 [Firmicutes bacterium]|nr:hypothetical protein [Bacillota bacterium]